MNEDAPRPDPATEAFVAHRDLLFTVAYEILGSALDAEDVLQETWLRWAGVGLAAVRDRRAHLVRIATRQALGRLRALSRRKESYVGPWLPEPLLTVPDAAEDVELTDSMSMAMMPVLETLAAFQRALETGDLRNLLDLLAPDVVALSDGGGIKRAMPRPVVGAAAVARALAAGVAVFGPLVTVEPTLVNGHPALVLRADGAIDMVVAVRIDDGLVTGLYSVRNPEKLTRMERETAVSR
ncbi:sigma factor [Streptomyces sp. NPDC059708]|uniref:sigma factor n=1 Tax=Streptomyces sp. NPDC059708 TaxID=3346916 RepID=UPI003697E2BD